MVVFSIKHLIRQFWQGLVCPNSGLCGVEIMLEADWETCFVEGMILTPVRCGEG
jgi:hypothetical protein